MLWTNDHASHYPASSGDTNTVVFKTETGSIVVNSGLIVGKLRGAHHHGNVLALYAACRARDLEMYG